MVWENVPEYLMGIGGNAQEELALRCKTTISIRAGSCFDDVRSDLRHVILQYIAGARRRLRKKPAISLVCHDQPWSRYIRIYDIYANYILRQIRSDLGGRDVICQVDESVFSYKPKYIRGGGMKTEEIWVFGIVDTSYTPARGYMQVVNDRSSEHSSQLSRGSYCLEQK